MTKSAMKFVEEFMLFLINEILFDHQISYLIYRKPHKYRNSQRKNNPSPGGTFLVGQRPRYAVVIRSLRWRPPLLSLMRRLSQATIVHACLQRVMIAVLCTALL